MQIDYLRKAGRMRWEGGKSAHDKHLARGNCQEGRGKELTIESLSLLGNLSKVNVFLAGSGVHR